MEYVVECIALAVDTLVFGICFNSYLRKKRAVVAIKGAEILDLNDKLEHFVQSQPHQRVPYCAIRGTVVALGSPIRSSSSNSITGVIKKLSIKQHVVSRGSAGFWSEHERTIHEVFNDVPFAVRMGNVKVEVLDATCADILDLDTISDVYEPTVASLGDHLWSFFHGTRQQGLQTTEEMLREGALMTTVGELNYDLDFKDLRIQPPLNGKPYYLTTLPLSSLVRRVNKEKTVIKVLTILFGGVGIVLICLIARRWWKIRAQELMKAERQRVLEETRKTRRSNVREVNLPENQLCTVCRENPKEIILLPCGHVCICEDCSEGITDLCPVCREPIVSRAAAYLT